MFRPPLHPHTDVAIGDEGTSVLVGDPDPYPWVFLIPNLTLGSATAGGSHLACCDTIIYSFSNKRVSTFKDHIQV